MAMMDTPLNSWLLFEHARRHHAGTGVVSRLPNGRIHRYTYAEFSARAQQLMHALDRLGIAEGDRVATLAWNSYRHLEAYFGVPCSGRILHTLNLRLSPAELGYIIADADDRAILVDEDLLPLLEQVGEALAGVRHVIVFGDGVPATSVRGVVGYEQLIAGESTTYPRKEIPETTPLGICYTSGTTGRPKGAVYTHRSTFLHSLAASSRAGIDIGPEDAILPVVPMFHASAWGMPHAGVAVGAKQVFSAGALDPAALIDLLIEEEVTITAGVPTVWLAVADELGRRGGRLPALRHIVCGGSQPPRALIERYLRDFDIPIIQAWGMTETSPLASIAWPKHAMRDWPEDRLMDAVRSQAGIPLPGVDISVRGATGEELPADGTSMGSLLVRGPWVVDSYWKGAGPEQFTEDGWFVTGDVAIESPEGHFVIADRTKDLIKSGGEWISSVDMEGDVMAMAEVVEAAVIAIPDEKWQERPLVCVVPRAGCEVTLEEVRAQLESRGWAHWQLPSQLEVVDAVPKTSVGKFDKKVLRARFVEVVKT
jgi:acyl-CoA synthetase (AMP-forming)/AMP-acid ligase II